MFTPVYLCLPLFTRVCLPMFTNVYECYLYLHFVSYVYPFTRVYLCLLVFTYV